MAARAAADDMYGIENKNKGYIGASCIRVFGLNAASVGLNESAAKKAWLSYDYSYVLPSDKVSIMPNSNYLCLKLLFEVPTGRILGAQAIGKGEADRRIDVISAIIHMNGTLEDVKDLELCYSPVYSTAKDAVNMAALVGLNILTGRCKQVHVNEIRSLVESVAYIVDVREEGEFNAGHIKGAHNVPLSQLRERMDEIPKDVPVYLHCRSSQRSYNAVMCLQGHGYDNVYNIAGSYLGFCLYEYFDDVRLNREPIFTAYNFR
jgi:rhodanese-related sulfurtransferase